MTTINIRASMTAQDRPVRSLPGGWHPNVRITLSSPIEIRDPFRLTANPEREESPNEEARVPTQEPR